MGIRHSKVLRATTATHNSACPSIIEEHSAGVRVLDRPWLLISEITIGRIIQDERRPTEVGANSVRARRMTGSHTKRRRDEKKVHQPSAPRMQKSSVLTRASHDSRSQTCTVPCYLSILPRFSPVISRRRCNLKQVARFERSRRSSPTRLRP